MRLNSHLDKIWQILAWIAASIGPEVYRYYCRAGLFGSICDLFMQIISPLGGWLVSALSISDGKNGSIPLLTLTLTTITSMQRLNKQAFRLLQVHTTLQPPSKITVCKRTRLNTYLWNKNQKEWHCPPNILKLKNIAGVKESPHLTGGPKPRQRSVGRERTQKLSLAGSVCVYPPEAGGEEGMLMWESGLLIQRGSVFM